MYYFQWTLVGLLFAFSSMAQPTQAYEFTAPHMGTQFRVVLYAADSASARHAADQAFARVSYLNQLLSDYLEDSELNRLSATAGTGSPVPVSNELWTVLHFAQTISNATDGAFDVTIGTLSKLWRKAFRQQVFPSKAEIEQARFKVGYQHLLLDANNQTVALKRTGTRLDLGAIAKGFAVDEAMKAMEQQGISHALVDGGGDLLLKNDPAVSHSWHIAIQNGKTLPLANCAIATSGKQYKFLEHKGKRYSHLIDPRTGMGVTHERQITIIADTAMKADALASACSVLSKAQAKRLARSHERQNLC
ncbi:MAG: FAD:protein FMN transferase [Saprospiraceae bacterium]|nr:FAD:protein FMN transferase [Saprospiraceae bacterium]